MTTIDIKPIAKTMTEKVHEALQALVVIGGSNTSHTTYDYSGDMPRLIPEGEPAQKVTPAQARAHLIRYLKITIDANKPKAVSALPTASTTIADFNHVMAYEYVLAGGDNAGKKVNLFAHGLKSAGSTWGLKTPEQQAKMDADNAQLKLLVDANLAFYAPGVVLKKGEKALRPYASMTKAVKAWCRTHRGAKAWFVADVKQQNLAEGRVAVFQGLITGDGSTKTSTAQKDIEAPSQPVVIGGIVQAPTVVSTPVAGANVDDAQIIALAQTLGSKATTVAGARKALARSGITV